MPPEFFDFFNPPPEEQNVVLVNAATPSQSREVNWILRAL